MIEKEVFGMTDGFKVFLFTLKNSKGMTVKLTNYSGAIVSIIVPDKSDWGFMNEITREYSIELMRAGVSIFVFDGAYDHTKIFITDDHLASCGTVNMDYRSLRTNWEDGYLFYDSGSIAHFKSLFEELQEQSRLLGPDAQPARGLRKGYRKLIRKMSPLF